MKISVLILAASFAMVGIPLASAAEPHPDCESSQPWIGYRSSEPIRTFYGSIGSPGGVKVCEGEHWDGQDTAQPSQNPGCGANVNTDINNAGVVNCLGSDPNAMAGDDATTPLGVRVTTKNLNQVYVGLNILLVGRAVVYADEDMAAVYVRDNTPGNLLAQAVSAPRITQGYVSEGDCDQATYQTGAMTGNPNLCGRDNTAITVQHGLLP